MRWLGVVFLGFAALCIATVALVSAGFSAAFREHSFLSDASHLVDTLALGLGGFWLLGGVLLAWFAAVVEWVPRPRRAVSRVTWALALLASLGNCGAYLMADPDRRDKPARTPPRPDAGPPATTRKAPAPVVPFTDDEIEEKLQLWCTNPSACQCLRTSFYALAPTDKRSTMSRDTVDELIGRAREECELRSDKMRKGVIVTCEDGKGTRAVQRLCACATSKFFERTTVEDLREIRRDGWTNRTMLLLDDAKQRCASAP